MNAQGYTEQDYDVKIKEGDYLIQLGMGVDVSKGGYNIREIPIRIRDNPDAHPDKWSWFDRPSDPDEAKKWDAQMTRNADAFGVRRGDFDPRSWYGKTGMVHIGEDKNKYMKVKYAIVDGAAPATSTPDPYKRATQPAPTNGGYKAPSRVPEYEPNDSVPPDFPDDIPF